MTIPFPSFSKLEEAVRQQIPSAVLLWLALSCLSSLPDYKDLTPEGVFNKLKENADRIYN